MKIEKKMQFLGLFMVLLWIIGAYAMIREGWILTLLWFCYNTSLFAGIMLIFKKYDWIAAEIALLLIPQTFWTIDLIGRLLFGIAPFGFVEYLFQTNYPIIPFILALTHLISMPLYFYILHLVWTPKNIIKKAAMRGWSLLFISYFFDIEKNINCIHNACAWMKNMPYYTISWIIYLTIVGIIINYILMRIYRYKLPAKSS